MTEEQRTLKAVKAAINSMPMPARVEIHECAARIEKTIQEYTEDVGPLALALVGAERAASE